jgi:hypothetical protein
MELKCEKYIIGYSTGMAKKRAGFKSHYRNTFFRIKILFWPMPFVNHDSEKSKFRDRIFFFTKFHRKNIEFIEKFWKIRMELSKNSDLTIVPEFFNLRQFSTGLRISLRGELISLLFYLNRIRRKKSHVTLYVCMCVCM